MTSHIAERLAAAVEILAPCQLECDGMTNALSALLVRFKIAHSVHRGAVHERAGNQVLQVHYWIVLADGITADLRLRMWLGNESHIPHGLFLAHDYPGVDYKTSTSFPASSETVLPDAIVDLLTDQRFSRALALLE